MDYNAGSYDIAVIGAGHAGIEAALAAARPSDQFQFLRLGYFCADSRDSPPDHPVFNRAVSQKDSFKPAK